MVTDCCNSICDCRKALQNGHHDRITNTSNIFVSIAFLAKWKNKRKTISYNIHSPFSFENSHEITLSISREF